MTIVNVLFRPLVVALLLAQWLVCDACYARAAEVREPVRGTIARSAVSDILDSLVNATYFRDEHFAPAKEPGPFAFPPNFIPQYSDSTLAARIATLNGKTPLKFVFNEHVKGFIRIYAVEKRNLTAKILGLTKIYFPLIEEKLDGQNIPLEIKYLAIVESALNPTAVSPAGAKGLWQFMYGTGKMYGLQSSSFIEDRYDPYKATIAASRHLKDLYNIYGDWFLALAAYNAGPGNVNKAIRRAGGIKDYWAIWDYLPVETRGYVPAFIAVNYVMNYYNEHNIRPVEPGFLYQDVDTLHVSRMVSFEQINQTIGVPMDDLSFLNPQYKLGVIPALPGVQNTLRLPKKFIGPYQRREREIYAWRSARTTEREELLARVSEGTGELDASGRRIHVVQRGETLGSIARLYRTYISQLISWNNMQNSDVQPGQRLIVLGETKEDLSMPGGDRVRKVIVRHRVRRGETVYSIARRYGMDEQRLMELNKLSRGRELRSGMRIKVEKEVKVAPRRSRSTRSSVRARSSKSSGKARVSKKGRSSRRSKRR